MTSGPSIAIVGGGAAAVCVLDALGQSVRAGAPAGEVTVFEPGTQLWRGRPYQRDVAAVRVNIPPPGMSVRYGDSGHFARWLAATGQPAGPDNPHHDPYCDATFVPRSVYGDYLEYAAAAAVERLREHGWQFSLVRDRVIETAPAADLIGLRSADGAVFFANYVVLCIGAGPPKDDYQLTGSAGFIAEPYPLARTLLGIDEDATVGVIGSGLTGVDTVLALADRGHRGRIRLLSRSGVLPAVRQRVVPRSLRYFTAERLRAMATRGERTTLAGLAELMDIEVVAAGGDPAALVTEIGSVEREDPEHRLRRQLAEVDVADPALRILQHAVPAVGPDVWPLLDEAEQRSVLRDRYRTVMSLCCPMPPTTARRLVGLIESGQLEIVPGLQGVSPSKDGGFQLRTVAGQSRVDVVVNAVNPSPHATHPAARPLIDSLVRAGLAVRHPLGGVRVSRATSGLATDRAVSRQCYVLGTLASGSLFFTFGMPSVVDRAADIVQAVVADVATAEARGLSGSTVAG